MPRAGKISYRCSRQRGPSKTHFAGRMEMLKDWQSYLIVLKAPTFLPLEIPELQEESVRPRKMRESIFLKILGKLGPATLGIASAISRHGED